MNFKLPDEPVDLSIALREIETSRGALSADAKAVLIMAASALEDFKRERDDAVRDLEAAAAMRTGQMDSQSRLDEVARQIRVTLTTVAQRLRAL